MLKCEMFLLKRAINKCNANYIHLISGEDYPIKPLDTFLSTFEQAMGINFLSYIHLPHPKWQNNTYERFEYYYPFDFFHDRTKSRQAAEKWRDFQKKWHIRRSIPHYFDHLYTAKVYVSISTGNACKERYIPSIKCAIQTASNYVTQVLYSKRNSNSTIRSNTPIANFGYYRLKDEQVMLIMDDNKPIYITY